MKQAAWLVASAETASQFLSAILKSSLSASPIATLQSHGYFLNSSPDFFKQMETRYESHAMQQFIECQMWVYLDHKRPTEALRAVIGQTKVDTASDAESLLCVWINAVVKRHMALPQLSSVSRHFLGYPHFRVVIYNFVRDTELLNISTDQALNAQVGLSKAIELSLTPPFPPERYEQSPLLLMCYLYSCIAGLTGVPPPKPPRLISKKDICAMLGSLEDAKKELAVVNARVATLNESIVTITEKLKTMKRPRSALARTLPAPVTGSADDPRPESALGQSQETRRVTWQLPEQTGESTEAVPDPSPTVEGS
jgi:hypothetical protein